MNVPRALCALALLGCAGSPTPAPQTPTTPTSTSTSHGTQAQAPRSGACPSLGGMVVEGQLGTLPQGVVSRVVRDATTSLAECYTRRHQSMPFLAGAITLKLRVGNDGAVRYALPIESTLGDRETERCMVDRAQTLHFTEPCGGEAEVTFPLELEASEDARPATPVPASRLEATLREHRAAVARCTAGTTGASFRVTLYLTPEGRVASSGTSIPSPEAVPAADCITREVASWRVPSPGSWYARTTLELH